MSAPLLALVLLACLAGGSLAWSVPASAEFPEACTEEQPPAHAPWFAPQAEPLGDALGEPLECPQTDLEPEALLPVPSVTMVPVLPTPAPATSVPSLPARTPVPTPAPSPTHAPSPPLPTCPGAPATGAQTVRAWETLARATGVPPWRCVLDVFAQRYNTSRQFLILPMDWESIEPWERWASAEGRGPWQLIVDAQRYHRERTGLFLWPPQEWTSAAVWERWAQAEGKAPWQLISEAQQYHQAVLGQALATPSWLGELERWNAWAARQRQPIWRYLMDAQRWAVARSGVPMLVPEVPNPARWDDWAAEARMDTHELLLKVFFADAPMDGPLEQAALAETNRHRAANGLPPVQLDPFAVLAARAHAIYDVIQFKSHGHEELDGTTGFFGRWPSDRAGYFGAGHARLGENLHGLRGPKQTIESWMQSPGHRSNLLTQSGSEQSPLVMGYAEATMGRYVNATMAIGMIE